MSTLTRLLKLMAPFKWWVAFGVLLIFLTIGIVPLIWWMIRDRKRRREAERVDNKVSKEKQ